MYFYVSLSCEEANCLINLALSSEDWALFWPVLIERLAFLSNFVGLFTKSLAYLEKINLVTLISLCASLI